MMYGTANRPWWPLAGFALALAGCGEEGLPAPSRFMAWPSSGTLIYLSWDMDSTDHEGFRVYRDDGSGSGFVELVDLTADWSGYWDDTVTPGMTYTYYVVAYAGAEESGPSNYATMAAFAPYCDVLTPRDGEVLWLGQMVDISWLNNDPTFDARISLSQDGGPDGYPDLIQPSWTGGSPWQWKAGYKNTAATASETPIWEQVVMATCTQCRIKIYSYTGDSPATGFSQGTFTIQVP